MEELNRILAANISTLRQRAGMTQAELAQKLNYSDKLISKWERGDAAPNAYTLKQLSEIFDVSLDYLFAAHEDEPPLPADGDGASAGMGMEAAGEATGVFSFASRVRKNVLLLIGLCGVALLALLVFVVLWIVKDTMYFSIFAYVLPAIMITWLVLNSVWYRGRHNYWIIAGLVAAIAVAVYVALLRFNCWQIFLLLIPAELMVLLAAKVLRK